MSCAKGAFALSGWGWSNLNRRIFFQRGRQACTRAFSTDNNTSTHFGFQEVPFHDKKGLVGDVFTKCAADYDLMNDLMSAGIHRLWKQEFLSMLNPMPGIKHLDVAGGTGDIGFGVMGLVQQNAQHPKYRVVKPELLPSSAVTICDINPAMLAVGKERAQERDLFNHAKTGGIGLDFVVGDAEQLPFADNTFDAYTIAFGLRNVTEIDKALADAFRVLKPGGRLMVLEFSQVTNAMLRQIYDTYSFNVIPLLGEMVVNDRPSYQYLVESIRKFPTQFVLEDMLRDAGFSCVTHTNFTFGTVAVHSGFKL